jgi:hypothetical protein
LDVRFLKRRKNPYEKIYEGRLTKFKNEEQQVTESTLPFWIYFYQIMFTLSGNTLRMFIKTFLQ